MEGCRKNEKFAELGALKKRKKKLLVKGFARAQQASNRKVDIPIKAGMWNLSSARLRAGIESPFLLPSADAFGEKGALEPPR